jgi:hypothetical protein
VLSIGLLIIKSNIPAVEFKDNYPIPENNQSHFLTQVHGRLDKKGRNMAIFEIGM